MVSLWPFKGEDNSPASFEKALATISAKITRASARLDLHRQHARRFKALWTLYTTFIYLLYSIILALVLGWTNWGLTEYAAIAGGPILIYVVRAGAAKYYDYRIEKTQQYLEDLQKQRDETIEKLKVATRYDSTQELLEKYAGESPRSARARAGDDKRKADGKRKASTGGQQPPQQPPQPPVQRTGLPPPPTANIRRPPQSPPLDRSPSQPPQPQSQPPNFFPPSPPPPPGLDEPGFAPNAFPAPPQYIEQSRWYDRLLDVLLGEDETQPKNRIALICSTCRLVNGQAPPGMKSLEELGRWRCGSCGAWNGEESAAKKVLADIQKQPAQPAEGAWDPDSDDAEAEIQSSMGDVTDEGVMVPSEDEQIESHSSGAETPNEDDVSVEAEEEPQPIPKKRGTPSQQPRGRRGRRG